MSKTVLISYDLHKPHRNYDRLFEGIKALANGWAKPLESVWLIRSTRTLVEIRDALRAYVDDNDALLVLEIVGHKWATTNVAPAQTEWMKSHVV